MQTVVPQHDDRHTFYQHSASLHDITTNAHVLYTSSPDAEGFCRAREGEHVIPFAMKIPKHGGAKGALPSQGRNSASIRYIAMASIRIKDSRTSSRSIAHFYRNIELWPAFDPSRMLAATPSPLYATAAKTIWMGGPGKVKLTASLHRENWVAGQRCYFKVYVANDSSKKVKEINIVLVRTDTVYRLDKDLDATSPDSRGPGSKPPESAVDPDACQTTTVRKAIAETTLEMGNKASTGYATAKGWWTGVEPGEALEFTHYLVIPVC